MAGGSDAELMAAIGAGDESALARLYDRHGDAVFRLAYRLLGDRSGAEEVLQETMLAVWQKVEQYDPARAAPAAWLMRIARNRAVDRLRARGRRPATLSLVSAGDARDSHGLDLDAAIEAGSIVAAAPLPLDPVAAADAAWLRDAVRAALDTLPDAERRALELAYYEELTQPEVAARLGWPLGTVKTRTRRALLRLRAALAETLGPDLGATVAPLPEPDAGTATTPERQS
jgi:RNA polymerase sigma-70 factor (ECF subfamily)